MNLSVIVIGAFELGGIFALLALGCYISFNVLDIPDLTVDGSFTTGCAVSAVVTTASAPGMGMVLAFVAGCLAGLVTGLLMTKLHINEILSGILTQTALYSVNLRIMHQTPNIALLDKKTIFSGLSFLDPYDKIILIYLIVAVIAIAMNYFLKTQLGLALRACGDNEDMVRASSIDTDKMKMIGLALANGLVGLSGALYTQQQGYADITSGIGMMVIGLASIIIGQTFIRSTRISLTLLAAVIGAIIYRFILTIAISFGVPSGDLNLLSSAIVVLAIAVPILKRRKKRHA